MLTNHVVSFEQPGTDVSQLQTELSQICDLTTNNLVYWVS